MMSKVTIEVDIKEYMDKKFSNVCDRLDTLNGQVARNTRMRHILKGVSATLAVTGGIIGYIKLI